MITIIDYGLGNLRSVRRGLERCGAEVEVSHRAEDIAAADGLVLPGVGAFDDGVRNLEPVRHTLMEAVESGTPVLGICLGMQMLLDSSEEGEEMGLGLVPGRSVLFREGKVPHMGWNTLTELDHPIFTGVEEGSHVYFVHSYHAETGPENVAATSEYHGDFPAAVARENVVGTQFHPEKSGELGLRMLRNFVEMC